jgi:hypothetical protein
MPTITAGIGAASYKGCTEMSSRIVKFVSSTVAVMLVATALAACGWAGDTGSVKKATDLAIDCKTDEALAALNKAQEGGGLGKYLSYLERVGILRDAGRMAEAEKALEVYMALPETASSDPAEVEKSVQKFVDELRKERQKRTGTATCS